MFRQSLPSGLPVWTAMDVRGDGAIEHEREVVGLGGILRGLEVSLGVVIERVLPDVLVLRRKTGNNDGADLLRGKSWLGRDRSVLGLHQRKSHPRHGANGEHSAIPRKTRHRGPHQSGKYEWQHPFLIFDGKHAHAKPWTWHPDCSHRYLGAMPTALRGHVCCHKNLPLPQVIHSCLFLISHGSLVFSCQARQRLRRSFNTSAYLGSPATFFNSFASTVKS